jgi:DNA-binding LacI/PurR family transcriptional regulator
MILAMSGTSPASRDFDWGALEIMMMRAKKATLKSIAKDLGITHTTVSNVYNNPAKVSEALRQKILDYARRVNYEGPNPTARSLKKGRCGAIGIIFNDQLSYAFTDAHDIAFLQGVSSVCEIEGTNIVLIPLMTKASNKLDMLTAIVDGYILNAPYKDNPGTQKALARGLPTVVVDFDAPQHVSVMTNDRAIMAEVTRHILDLGHRRIAIVTFPHSEGGQELFSLDREISLDNYVVSERLQGCRQALVSAGIALDTVLVCEAPNSGEGGKVAVDRMLSTQPGITAFICLSDRLAYGAMARCRQLGLSIPDRVSVTGFDNLLPIEREPDLPRLTTVAQNAFEKGRKAAEALLSQNSKKERRININAEFILGESTGIVER